MNKNNSVFAFVVGLCIIFLVVFGYVRNIIRLCHTDFHAPYKAEVLRGIGIFLPPMGVVEGYVTINDN